MSVHGRKADEPSAIHVIQSMKRDPVLVDLALQGGGAPAPLPGAYSTVSLDKSWLRIEGISGTSAGAMNAAVMVDGYTEGGAAAAKSRLELFWKISMRPC